MRITPGMSAENAIYNLQQGRTAIDQLQEQIASGYNINRPSDDPLSTRQLLDLQEQIASGDQYSSNITKAETLLNVTNTSLTSMATLMQQVKKIAGDMVAGTLDAAGTASAVANLTQLKSQLVDMGNTRLGDQYVFGGFSTSQPFSSTGVFSGTTDIPQVEIAPNSTVGTTVSGADLLNGGKPAAAVGSGATAGQSPVNILGSIDALILAINNKDSAGILDGVKNVKAGADQITVAQSDVAGRLVRLDNMKSMIANNQNTLKTVFGDIQNVDYAKAGVMLSRQTTAFNAALSATSKLSQLSLLDYMK
ncbi:flagellar hook-associated protein FlgL [Geomonas paludis]|uniref:Flagellar hook-associated protein 3 n=1 Tax=Geomonas paludis TaxID=2740185 RepID=A0A6V8N0S9_9BACT|nr:flagellar hook-associated protein FlgL [Geomonas paludis]UPU36472.1 flagellar hook-associated protein FlgL [Geomonas paludis]GFO65353.1 flagellar hook-associated protein 3 [Geomonas paludis]